MSSSSFVQEVAFYLDDYDSALIVCELEDESYTVRRDTAGLHIQGAYLSQEVICRPFVSARVGSCLVVLLMEACSTVEKSKMRPPSSHVSSKIVSIELVKEVA